jgi:putative membrane protein
MQMKNIRYLLAITAISASGFAASDSPSTKDQEFAKEAARGGMAEVQLGQLAMKSGQSPKVTNFARTVVADHTKTGDELKSIAQKKMIALPSDLSEQDKGLYTRLSKLNGAAFDKAYMDAMVKDHETDIADFEKEANSGADSELRRFATKTIPTLKQHLQMAKAALGAASSEK